jgi:hypothetical protein
LVPEQLRHAGPHGAPGLALGVRCQNFLKKIWIVAYHLRGRRCGLLPGLGFVAGAQLFKLVLVSSDVEVTDSPIPLTTARCMSLVLDPLIDRSR